MDTTIIAAFGFTGSAIGWLVLMIFRANSALSAHKLHVAENYSSKEDTRSLQEEMRRGFNTVNTTITTQFTRIFDKLDSKQDKP